MIGVIVAMQIEFDSMLKIMENVTLETVGNHSYAVGTIAGKQLVLAHSGVGKVAAGISTAKLIEKYHPEFIINTGVAGGLKDYENVCDIVISDRLTYHDWDTTPVGDDPSSFDCAQYIFQSDKKLVAKAKAALETVSASKVYVGDIVSGDQFIVTSNVERIVKQFPTAIASEMEATAIAHGCSEYNVPFVCIRSLSDIPVKEGTSMDFIKFVEIACATSAKFMELFFKNY